MRRWTRASSVIFLLSGCGEAPPDDTTDTSVGQEETRCLSCDVTLSIDGPTTYNAEPRVSLSPTELLFYPDDVDSPGLDPQLATVTNATSSYIFVIWAGIADSADPLEQDGGADYFDAEEIDEPVLLGPSETTSIAVWFLGSFQHRAAQLIVKTTHPRDNTLSVDLYGKFIVAP